MANVRGVAVDMTVDVAVIVIVAVVVDEALLLISDIFADDMIVCYYSCSCRAVVAVAETELLLWLLL